ncbi:GNAT family N-acetyltransferase [Niveispirillum sp.]|uniref:GNAT family N-acetyltransferase n=1 Tax=Niveispirillum sp. TaxID=1917217 RepID=UPI001B43A22B|nr:GNAT family N-acetyltransferase [Niveispirillum sp.]MBP7338199.1 GNAT family N-acetyltransferase [Niveispirillum sp.]
MTDRPYPLYDFNRIDTAPVILAGAVARLEPLRADHLDALCAVGLEGDIFRWYPTPVRSREEMAAWIGFALAERQAGRMLPFVTIDQASGHIAGSTRFLAMDRANRHVEIGYTWLGKGFQRSGLNREAKYLMLRHAFEHWGCIRVEFKTDSNNTQSRMALAGIGAVEEGTFRNHVVRADGSLRHSVYFSITDREWPAVKERLTPRGL